MSLPHSMTVKVAKRLEIGNSIIDLVRSSGGRPITKRISAFEAAGIPMDSYKQSIPAIGLAIERTTPNVPTDGCYYVWLNGKIQGRHRLLRKAQAQYRALLEQSGGVRWPRKVDRLTTPERL